jgi:hypothetical protein
MLSNPNFHFQKKDYKAVSKPDLLFSNNRLQSFSREDKQDVDVVEPEELSLFARLVGEDTQARVIESISTWANDKAKENPGCVERFVCETYKTGETMTGVPYLLMSLTK